MDDGPVVTRIRSGNGEAFGTLIDRHQTRIVRLCYRITGNVPDAEDLAHQAFVEAYVKLDQLRDPSRFAQWLRMIALNLCRLWYRERRDGPAEIPEDVADNTEGGGAIADRLNSGLAQLSESHRLAIVLHHCEGLSYEEVASVLNVPVGTVMSRLNRARTQLKRITKEMADLEEIPNTNSIDFKREVEVEIDALLKMFNDNPRAIEGLSVILNNAPERFAALIRQADTMDAQWDLALLLRRLGHAGIDITVDCYLSTDLQLSASAGFVLKRFIAQGKSSQDTSYPSRVAARGAYLVVDTVIRSSASERRKAALLADLLLETPDERATLLLMNALLCYEDEAFDILMDRMAQSETPEALHARTGTLQALCRLGTRFAAHLIRMLKRGDSREVTLALAGADALARSLFPGWLDPETTSDDALLVEQRFRLKWTPPVKKYRDPMILNDLRKAIAELVASEYIEHRDAAIRVLGLLHSDEYLDLLRAASAHETLSTRLFALRALGDCGDLASDAILRAATFSGDGAERRVAVEIMGRLKIPDGLGRITEMLQDEDPQVRRVAVTAIGEYEGDEARSILEGLTRSKDRQLVKAAASALYGNKTRHQPEANGLDYYKVFTKPGTMGDMVRGGCVPPYYISLDAAIRVVPELKPYGEMEFSRIVAQVCYDYACTRRYLVEEGLTRREGDHYHFTEIGRVVWRVERFIRDRAAKLAAE